MKRLLIVTVFALMCHAALCQISIPSTNVTFNLPEGNWKYLQTKNIDKNTNVYLYYYAGNTLIDSVGDTVLPFLRIYVRKSYSGEVYELAYERYLQQPFETLKEYDNGLVTDDAMGYDGAYTSQSDGKDYRFKMIYFRDKKNIIEFRLETTRDTFKEMVDEFDDIIDSIEIGQSR